MSRPDYVQVFRERGKLRQWRWRLKAGNHRTISTSGESFITRAAAVRAAKRVTGLDPQE